MTLPQENLSALYDKTYSSEFKREAIELAATSGKTVKELERELGLGEGSLRLWMRKAREEGGEAFPGHGRLKPAEEEMRRMRRELEIMRQELDIQK